MYFYADDTKLIRYIFGKVGRERKVALLLGKDTKGISNGMLVKMDKSVQLCIGWGSVGRECVLVKLCWVRNLKQRTIILD